MPVSVAKRLQSAVLQNLGLFYDPKESVESDGDAIGVVSRPAEGDLERFKEFIEQPLGAKPMVALKASGCGN